ncbi:MAG: selenium-dependent molybdenum cofactor biosynthesis protein YqeB [Bacillota bacterium]
MKGFMVLIKGAGDLASGTAHRLIRSGFNVVMLETPAPTAIRRTVSFSEAVFTGRQTIEGVTAVLAKSPENALGLMIKGVIPVMIDPSWSSVGELRPEVVVDAVMAKRNLGTTIREAPIVIGLGPGFNAGEDVHAVVETCRGHYLGRVITEGAAIPDTGIPGIIEGFGEERVVRSPEAGIFMPEKEIGDTVSTGEVIGLVGKAPVKSGIPGVLRGILKSGMKVHKGMKVGDVDPRCIRECCYIISDKSRAVAGGVLEAILMMLQLRCHGGAFIGFGNVGKDC